MDTVRIPHGIDMSFFRRLTQESLFPASDYQRLEYITMGQNCYITLGNHELPDIGVFFDFLMVSHISQYGPILVTTVNNDEQNGHLVTLGPRTYASGLFVNLCGVTTSGLGTVTLNQRAQIYVNVRNDGAVEVPVDNISQTVDRGTVTSGVITLCQDITSPQNGYNLNGRIYGVSFYSAGKKKIELIPCYRKSDNAAGLIDVYTNTFYGNNGTGTILAGPEV